MRRWVCLAALVLSVGCPQNRPSAVRLADGSFAPDAGFRLTRARLDAWIRLGQVVTADAGQGVRERARRHAEGARRAGLSMDEIDFIESAVVAVLAQRMLGRLSGAEALGEFDEAPKALGPEQQLRVDEALGELKAKARQVASLDVERQRFGSEAVDLILEREAEVEALWERLTALPLGER